MNASLVTLSDGSAMTPELIALALSALVLAVQFALYSVRAQMDVGTGYAMSPRDRDPSRALGTLAGRLQRAYDNHLSALTFFAPAALILAVTDQTTQTTATLAFAYLAARIAYVPAYAFGWMPWRSVIWMVGFGATIALYLIALL